MKKKNFNPTQKIIFYEWSDIKRKPITFDSVDSFKSFCANSNIKISNKNSNFIDASTGECYVTCKKGRAELTFSKNYRGLQKNASKYNCKYAASMS